MKHLKKIIDYSLIGVLIVFILLCISGFEDDVYIQKYYVGIWYKDILNYFKYLFLWVLPYWWLVIVLGGIVLGGIVLGGIVLGGIVLGIIVFLIRLFLYNFQKDKRASRQ